MTEPTNETGTAAQAGEHTLKVHHLRPAPGCADAQDPRRAR